MNLMVQNIRGIVRATGGITAAMLLALIVGSLEILGLMML